MCPAGSCPSWPSSPQSSSSTFSEACKSFKTASPCKGEAARRDKAEEAVHKQIVEETITVEDAEKETVVVAEHAAEELKASHVVDELCSNAEYSENILSEENSVRYRVLVFVQTLKFLKAK